MSAIALPPMARRPASRLLLLTVPLIVGALTEWSVPHLPHGLSPLANSAAPWVLVAFLLALTARRRAEAVATGVLALAGLVIGFYVVEGLRGWGVPTHQIAFWCVGSLVFGVPVGLAAHWMRRSGPWLGAAGAGIMGGMLVGEGVYALTSDVRWYTPHTYWHLQIVLGLGIAVVGTAWGARHRPMTLVPALGVSAGVGLMLAFVTWAAYTSA